VAGGKDLEGSRAALETKEIMESVKQPGVLGVVGNRPMQKRLLDYVRSGRIHPSLVFAGPDPEMKFRVAKNLAKAMLCEKPGTRAFCAVCSACKRVDKELHPDVLFLKEEGEDNLKIELVRSTCHQMEISPMEASVKICIVQECHRMNNASANAFLKTLEEPAPGRYFWLLTTQVGSLLPTILSRCLQFTFAPETDAVPDTQAIAELEALLSESLQTRNLAPLVAKLDDKDACLQLVRHLQHGFRAIATAQGAPPTPLFQKFDEWQALNKFDAAVALEGRLRSNANCGLLLEDFIRRELLT
jgi:hypothetical protein